MLKQIFFINQNKWKSIQNRNVHMCLLGIYIYESKYGSKFDSICCILLIDPTKNIIKDNEQTSMNKWNTSL